MARSFLGGEFAGGESPLWRGNWIPLKPTALDFLAFVFNSKGNLESN